MGRDRGQQPALRRQGQALRQRLVEEEQHDHPAEEPLDLRPDLQGKPSQALHQGRGRKQDERADRVGGSDDQSPGDPPRVPAGRAQADRDGRQVGERPDARGGLAQEQHFRPGRRGLEDQHRARRDPEQADREGVSERLARGEVPARQPEDPPGRDQESGEPEPRRPPARPAELEDRQRQARDQDRTNPLHHVSTEPDRLEPRGPPLAPRREPWPRYLGEGRDQGHGPNTTRNPPIGESASFRVQGTRSNRTSRVIEPTAGRLPFWAIATTTSLIEQDRVPVNGMFGAGPVGTDLQGDALDVRIAFDLQVRGHPLSLVGPGPSHGDLDHVEVLGVEPLRERLGPDPGGRPLRQGVIDLQRAVGLARLRHLVDDHPAVALGGEDPRLPGVDQSDRWRVAQRRRGEEDRGQGRDRQRGESREPTAGRPASFLDQSDTSPLAFVCSIGRPRRRGPPCLRGGCVSGFADGSPGCGRF